MKRHWLRQLQGMLQVCLMNDLHFLYEVRRSEHRLKAHFSLDLKKMILAKILFNGGHVQIHFKIHLTQIGYSFGIITNFLNKTSSKTLVILNTDLIYCINYNQNLLVTW